jgi:hypothetical protein
VRLFQCGVAANVPAAVRAKDYFCLKVKYEIENVSVLYKVM